ncbi:low-density lipoprotein receptor-related protein 5-like [Lytechinus pictus]|uniref:low-density lipoprotein receptor-related protein 5-like n=1 Tax=Lytechinus pictus TaxID=7653 RepID=UPI0030BA1192
MSKSWKGRKPAIHPSMLTIWFMIFFGGCFSPSISTDKLFLAEAELAVIIMAEAKDYSFVNQSFTVLPLTGLTFPVGVEYDPIGDQVYWTDAILHTVNRARLDGSSQEIIAQLQNVTGDFHYPYGIALNLDDEKVYWTDQYRDVIEMSNLDGTDRVVLILTGFNAYPHAIVYSTFRRKIYWTDHGQYSKIEMANPDGTERETLVDDEVEYPFADPTAICLDSTEQLLYWADITENSINFLNLETMEQGFFRIINSTQHPLDLAPFGVAKYFEDFYFTDNNYNGLYNVDVPENDIFLVLELPTPVEIHIYAGKDGRHSLCCYTCIFVGSTSTTFRPEFTKVVLKIQG